MARERRTEPLGRMVAATSAGLFLMAGTGLYLWFMLRPLRRVGAVLLVAGLCSSAWCCC